MTTVNVRYIVDDVDAAISFYTEYLNFRVEMNPAPGFAMLARGDLRLLLNAVGAGGAGQAMPDGSHPEPGGWNRIQLQVDDLESLVNTLRKAGAHFRNDIVTAGVVSKYCSTILPATASNCLSHTNQEGQRIYEHIVQTQRVQ